MEDNFPFNAVKFRELILYLAAGGMKDPGFGLVKLAKALYYADLSAYLELGRPITGATYRKYHQGPAPEQLPEQLRILADREELKVKPRLWLARKLQKPMPQRMARTQEYFAVKELALANEVITALTPMTEAQAAEHSRQEKGWQAAAPGEIIPYAAAGLDPGPVSLEAEDYAALVAARLDGKE